MKKLTAFVVVAFAIALAVVVGTRMDREAMAVMMGMVCGVVAGVPTSLLIAAVTNRRGREERCGGIGRDYPPVVVIQPGQGGPTYPSLPYVSPPSSPFATRKFHVVGEEPPTNSEGWEVLS